MHFPPISSGLKWSPPEWPGRKEKPTHKATEVVMGSHRPVRVQRFWRKRGLIYWCGALFRRRHRNHFSFACCLLLHSLVRVIQQVRSGLPLSYAGVRAAPLRTYIYILVTSGGLGLIYVDEVVQKSSAFRPCLHSALATTVNAAYSEQVDSIPP